MTVKELWKVSPQNFIFLKDENGRVAEYTGTENGAALEVVDILATNYPMYKNVIEVKARPIEG